MGEPDMRMSSDSGVKTETNTQREEEPWAFTKEGQSEACSVAPWAPSVWVPSGCGGRAELRGVGVPCAWG